MTFPIAIDLNPKAVPAAERAALLEDPGLGRVFTDHMTCLSRPAQEKDKAPLGVSRPGDRKRGGPTLGG